MSTRQSTFIARFFLRVYVVHDICLYSLQTPFGDYWHSRIYNHIDSWSCRNQWHGSMAYHY